ncbi:MAG TPA: HAMP domain-containing protein [Verrucomicrobiae bacterium]|jgi:methyl-accepting chemotaxis protein|nr:HAMP domain-containing protein [Verrucomicrobiae bacterium]
MAGAEDAKGDAHKRGQANGVDSPVGEVLEMARALSEGNLDCQLTREVQGELGALAGYIENLRQRLRGISSAADSSSYLIPQAAMGVAGISLQAEEGINSILGLVEEVLADQERVIEFVNEAKQAGGTADLGVFQVTAEKSRRKLMALMSQLSFQDVIRQRAEGVQETLEAVEKRIVELLIKFKVGLASETLKEVDGRDRVREEVKIMTDDIGLDQSLVDELLDNIK